MLSNPVLKRIKSHIFDREACAAALFGFAYWFVTILYLELLLHIIVFDSIDAKAAFAVGFSAVNAGVLALITSFLPKKAQFPVKLVLALVMVFLYGSQMVYNFVFGTMYSVAQIQQGGAAIASFWRETLQTMWENLPFILALLVPVIVLVLVKRFFDKILRPSNGAFRAGIVILTVLAYVITVNWISAGGTGYFSNYYFYNSADTTTTQVAERFGLLTAFRLELFGSGETADGYYSAEQMGEALPSSESEDGVGNAGQIKYNVIDIDFDALNTMTDDEKILAINEYCDGMKGTNKNEYTGMLREYNLIVLCAESFSTGAIHPEVTPTLYRLANEGIIFNNYYNTFPNNTTDGEYALCMGLYPDSSRTKIASSFYVSRESYMPFCLGKAFSEQAKIEPFGYHNYHGSFYGRTYSHTNMGYTMRFAYDGFEGDMYFTTNWPSSDLEMMKQSVDDYIGMDQFHAYYMTFSGHYKYNRNVNPMASRNWSAVENLEYSNRARCYLSCNVELDKALEYLMQRLEEKGIADKTVIVLAGDHFPYGLEDDHYSELVGEPIDHFNKYKSTLIFWVGGLEENIIVDEYCCNVDILPTILNLWGFAYDSRMLAGTDVFSDGTHVAVLADKSFFTDKVWFDANTGEVRYLVDESEIPADYVENMNRLIQTKHNLSVDILSTAYYNFVFEQGSVAVSNSGWTSWEVFKDLAVGGDGKPDNVIVGGGENAEEGMPDNGEERPPVDGNGAEGERPPVDDDGIEEERPPVDNDGIEGERPPVDDDETEGERPPVDDGGTGGERPPVDDDGPGGEQPPVGGDGGGGEQPPASGDDSTT